MENMAILHHTHTIEVNAIPQTKAEQDRLTIYQLCEEKVLSG